MKTLKDKKNDMLIGDIARMYPENRRGPIIDRLNFLESHIEDLEKEIIKLKLKFSDAIGGRSII